MLSSLTVITLAILDNSRRGWFIRFKGAVEVEGAIVELEEVDAIVEDIEAEVDTVDSFDTMQIFVIYTIVRKILYQFANRNEIPFCSTSEKISVISGVFRTFWLISVNSGRIQRFDRHTFWDFFPLKK